MPLTESVVFCNGILYMLLWTFYLPLLLRCMILFAMVFVTILNSMKISDDELKQNINWYLRRGCSSGTIFIILLPLSLILSVPSESETGSYGTGICSFSVGLMLASMLCAASVVTSSSFDTASSSVLGSVVLLVASICYGNNFMCVMLGGAAIVFYTKLQYLLPALFPHSFSLGESVIVCQGAACFFYTLLVRTANKLGLVSISVNHPDWNANVITFVEAAIIGGALVLIFLYKFPRLKNSSLGVIVTITGLIFGYGYPYLYYMLGRNPISWLAHYISNTSMNLFNLWLFGCIAATVMVYIFRPDSDTDKQILQQNITPENLGPASEQKHHGLNEKNDIDTDNRQTKTGVSSVVRKYFHYLVVCLFLPGISMDTQMMFTAASCALVVFTMLEVLRILRVWPVGEALYSYFQSYVDEKDSGYIITSHIYLLVGCSMPLWCYYGSFARGPPPILLCGILSVGIGDTAASVLGSWFGSFKWPGTNKTLEGTVGSIVVQLLTVTFLQGSFPSISITGMFVPIVLTSLLEAFTSQIDNLILPMFMYVMMAAQ